MQACLIAFVEQLAAAADLAAAVVAGDAKPTPESDTDEITASGAPVFSVTVTAEGWIETDMTQRMARLIASTLKDYRDYRWHQGFRLPEAVAAFGAEIGTLARACRPVTPSRPVARLPDDPDRPPLSKFMRPGDY